MEKNIFKLDNEQLKAIARSFKEKVEKGLNTENAEIQCIPTFITPKADNINGKSLVLDLGGTNYRVALVDFSKSVPDIHPNNGWKKDMSIMKSLGYTQEELFKELSVSPANKLATVSFNTFISVNLILFFSFR